MLCIRHAVRSFHQSPFMLSAVAQSNLAKLRKATGYSFSNCRKALDLHENDFDKAEKWLHEQAQSLGWSKATKLEGRKTTEGLVAVLTKGNHGVMVEINCETDFVARNQNFKDLAEKVAKACLQYAQNTTSEGAVTKTFLDKSSLPLLLETGGKSLGDITALTIGLVGENMSLRRATLVTTQNGVLLTGSAHPPAAEEQEVKLGKYGCLLALQKNGDVDSTTEEQKEASKKICQHVIGLNPIKVGDPKVDKPAEDKDEETALIHQDFVLDAEITVGEFLEDEGLEVLDFIRFECGDGVGSEAESNQAAHATG